MTSVMPRRGHALSVGGDEMAAPDRKNSLPALP
jgi:hypothetical protein